MKERAEREPVGSEEYPATLVAANNADGVPDQDEVRRAPTSAAHHARGREARPTSHDVPSIPQSVVGFIEKNPVVAAGAALAVGAAFAMAVQSRRTANSSRIDRRVQRAVRSMDRTFAREMKALRQSDMADRLGHFGTSLGDAFSRIDLAPLAERGRLYLDAARRRLGA